MDKTKVKVLPLLLLLLSLAGCGGGGTEADTPATSGGTNSSPTIEITGNASVSVRLGETYTDAGAVASDAEDGDLTGELVTHSDVNTAVAGIYQVNYSVTDSDGNSVQATRTVQVSAGSGVGDYAVSWESNFTLPPQDANGWSILTPSVDSRLIYVSSSDGDDANAQTYLPGDSEVGSDPFNPSVNILPYATIDVALAQARSGYPDYILLKRGDTWVRNSNIAMKAGRSANERAVLSYYGADTERPMVKHHGVNMGNASYSAVVGIRFTASQRNPASGDFVGLANVADDIGFQALGGYNNSVTGDLLIEDCLFDWFANNTIESGVNNGGPILTNVIIRRNIISDNYSTQSHAQGIFASWSSVLLEENVFDHNGWYLQAFSGSTREDGIATMFNHNTYFEDTRNNIFRKNIFIRGASSHNKFTSNTTSGTNEILTWNVLLDNNLYIDGEIGLSIGGNDDQNNGPRWRDIFVTNNIMMHIGRSQPTSRTLGWGMESDDWDGGLVKGNIFTHWGDSVVSNTFALLVEGDTSDVEYSDNIVYKVQSDDSLIRFKDGDIQTGTTFFGNEIQGTGNARLLLYALSETGGFHDNYYFSSADPSAWFALSGVNHASLSDYRTASGDNTSLAETRGYVDPDRTIETYLTAIGYATDMDTFVTELKKQSRSNWREEFTATTINNYVRQGFCLSGNTSCR